MTTNTLLKNTALKSGARLTWTQYPSRAERQDGRQRTGFFWALAPDTAAIWVRPDTPEPGEAVAIKVYRSTHRQQSLRISRLQRRPHGGSTVTQTARPPPSPPNQIMARGRWGPPTT